MFGKMILTFFRRKKEGVLSYKNRRYRFTYNKEDLKGKVVLNDSGRTQMIPDFLYYFMLTKEGRDYDDYEKTLTKNYINARNNNNKNTSGTGDFGLFDYLLLESASNVSTLDSNSTSNYSNNFNTRF